MDAILQKKKGGGGSDVHFISYTNTFQLFIKKNQLYETICGQHPFHMTTFCYFLTDLVHQS